MLDSTNEEFFIPKSIHQTATKYICKNQMGMEINPNHPILEKMERELTEIESKNTHKTYQSSNLTTSEYKKKDFFVVVRVQGLKIDQIEDKNAKFTKIANKSAKILDLKDKGKVTLNILETSQKKDLLFMGNRSCLQVNVNKWPYEKIPFEFLGVGYTIQ
jgi:hypothetical protein